MDLTITREEYESLLTLAQAGAASNPERTRQLDAWLNLIETRNGIQRYQLWVQWQETDSPLPPNTNFPEKWPPEMRYFIQLFRPISRDDVEAVLKKKARRAASVLVTPDPGAILGWTPLEAYFVQ